MTIADKNFIEMCTDILENGVWTQGDVRTHWPDGEQAHSIYTTNVVYTYDLQKEFPMLTLRRTAWRWGLGEIMCFFQDKSNDMKLLEEKYGVDWWKPWTRPDGTIGKSYGYQLGVEHEYPEGKMDQVDRLIYDLKKRNSNRRMVINMYNHHDLHDMSLYPCAFQTVWNTRGEYLDVMLVQRSSDVLAANNINLVQYSMLLMMIAQATGYKPGKITHAIGNCHIYDRHVEAIKEMIKQAPKEGPKVTLNPEVKDFYEFKVSDFKVEGYTPYEHERMEIAL